MTRLRMPAIARGLIVGLSLVGPAITESWAAEVDRDTGLERAMQTDRDLRNDHELKALVEQLARDPHERATIEREVREHREVERSQLERAEKPTTEKLTAEKPTLERKAEKPDIAHEVARPESARPEVVRPQIERPMIAEVRSAVRVEAKNDAYERSQADHCAKLTAAERKKHTECK